MCFFLSLRATGGDDDGILYVISFPNVHSVQFGV
jgi:hypothetical protein